MKSAYIWGCKTEQWVTNYSPLNEKIIVKKTIIVTEFKPTVMFSNVEPFLTITAFLL